MPTTLPSVEELRRRLSGEKRTLTASVTFDPEARTGGELRIRGLAAVFNHPTVIAGEFSEELAPGCFARSLRERGNDAALLWAHDPSRPLARCSNQTLELAETAEGLRFSARIVPTSYGEDAALAVRSGLVSEMSFGFVARKDEWSRRDGRPHRKVLDAELLEVSLVTWPAYGGTSAEEGRTFAGAVELRKARAGRLRVKARSPYQPGSGHSWFRDRIVVEAATVLGQRHRLAGDRTGDLDPGLASRTAGGDQGGLAEARARLAQHAETRDLTTTATDGGGFVPSAPEHIGEAFAAAVRARAVLASSVLPVSPLPPAGMTVDIPRVTSPVSAAVQATENTSLSQTDLVEELTSCPVTTIAAVQDLSMQLLDRSDPAIADVALAQELGRALGERLDTELLTGSGTAPYVLGLDNVTGKTSTAYTDASPTQQELWTKLLDCIAAVSVALGDVPTHALMHPRRAAWIFNTRDGATGLVGPPQLPFEMQLVPVPAITTAAGSGTNEDAIYVIRAPELPVFLAAPRLEVAVGWPEGSLSMTARVIARQYAATGFARRPEAVGIVSGTGLKAPVFA